MRKAGHGARIRSSKAGLAWLSQVDLDALRRQVWQRPVRFVVVWLGGADKVCFVVARLDSVDEVRFGRQGRFGRRGVFALVKVNTARFGRLGEV